MDWLRLAIRRRDWRPLLSQFLTDFIDNIAAGSSRQGQPVIVEAMLDARASALLSVGTGRRLCLIVSPLSDLARIVPKVRHHLVAIARHERLRLSTVSIKSVSANRANIAAIDMDAEGAVIIQNVAYLMNISLRGEQQLDFARRKISTLTLAE